MIPKRAITHSAFDVLELAKQDAEIYLNPFVTPEHVLFQIEASGLLREQLKSSGKSQCYFRERLGFFMSSLASKPSFGNHAVKISHPLRNVIESAIEEANVAEGIPVDIPHLLLGIALQRDSFAGYLLRKSPEVLASFGISLLDYCPSHSISRFE